MELNELRYCNHNYFCVRHKKKIGENVTNVLNCYFSKQIYTLWHIKLNFKMWKIKFRSYKQELLGKESYRNVKKTLQIKAWNSFFTLSEMKVSTNPQK